MFGYIDALKAAGMHVKEFAWFGDYSGLWAAHVVSPDGMIGYISDWYGSCTACDSFQAEMDEFMYGDGKKDYDEALKRFGQRYAILPTSHWLEVCRQTRERLEDEDDYVWEEIESMYHWILKQEGLTPEEL